MYDVVDENIVDLVDNLSLYLYIATFAHFQPFEKQEWCNRPHVWIAF